MQILQDLQSYLDVFVTVDDYTPYDRYRAEEMESFLRSKSFRKRIYDVSVGGWIVVNSVCSVLLLWSLQAAVWGRNDPAFHAAKNFPFFFKRLFVCGASVGEG